jgi:hypothetical protein
METVEVCVDKACTYWPDFPYYIKEYWYISIPIILIIGWMSYKIKPHGERN